MSKNSFCPGEVLLQPGRTWYPSGRGRRGINSPRPHTFPSCDVRIMSPAPTGTLSEYLASTYFVNTSGGSMRCRSLSKTLYPVLVFTFHPLLSGGFVGSVRMGGRRAAAVD